ncbi:hypothetical protein CNR22_17230 [Sphingobacteriaceae bacterium]|nr:hypothetical protein CNR22_17230 [Sphingobacteriaceae bacterium]
MKKFVLISLLLLCVNGLMAVIPPLEREINLTVSNERFSDVLFKIQEQTGLIFSYNPSIISGIRPLSLQIKHKTVREALAMMLPKTIIYKSKNNYIILKEKPAEKNQNKTEISGYVIDKKTEKKVANVTIYDKESLQSVTTDQYGFYSISVPATNEKISINKENYQDTILSLTDVKDNKINNISIAPVTEEQRIQDSIVRRDRLKELGLYTSNIYKKFTGFINTINIRDTITRPIQVSLLPFIGTNHRLSGSVENKLSFNILGGFSKGTKGFEVGGLFNIDRENVVGCQVATIFNIVGDSMKGTQLAALFNITGNYMTGFQGAGLLNINNRDFKGVQAATLLNLNNRKAEGVSIAALMNISNYVKGVQVSFLGNVSDTLNGVSLGGLFNVTEHAVKAVQAGFLFNNQRTGTSYVQVAGLFNTACYVKGIQIAPVNFADSASGVPIGFFSFVKKGVHQLELSSDELFLGNVSFRTGVPAFYNIFSIGFWSPNTKSLSQLGYGVGSSFRIKNKLRGDVTLTMHHISKGGFYYGTNDLYRAYCGIEYKFRKKFSVAAGPTFNLFMSDQLLPDYSVYETIMPSYLFSTTNSYDFNLKGWLGAKIALRFL